MASYHTVKWIGNLESRAVDVKTLQTSEVAGWCVEDTESGCKGTLPAQIAEKDPTKRRNIYINSNNSLVSFKTENLLSGHSDALSKGYLALSQIQALPDTDSKKTDPQKVDKLVDYLRGNKTYEDTSLNTEASFRLFRERQATLGDISQSRPNYFRKSNAAYLDPGYKNYNDSAGRSAAIYVGANDGMLHAFDATSGNELWAFIPTPVIPNLANLADKEYGANYHTNYVNGSPVIADVCVSGCTGSGAVWRTILVSGLNGGGRGYFAIDVTTPSAPRLLWEFGTQSSDKSRHLGYTFGNPVITKMQDGRWVVLVTSGYNNGKNSRKLSNGNFVENSPEGDGAGWLYVLDANTGAVVREISTREGDANKPSGLAKISAYAEQMFENNSALKVYGGDLNGNVWRFDINSGAVNKIATLKIGESLQSITTQPELGKVNSNIVVLVGTGKFLEPADLTNTPQNSVYAFKDSGQTTAIERTQLISHQLGADRKVTSGGKVNFETGYGWFMDFSIGERVNLDPLLVNGVLIMPTMVATSQACNGGGFGWFNFIDYKTGGSLIQGGVISEKMTSPAVGYNIVYDKNGVPHVVVTLSNKPTPAQLSLDDQVFGLSEAGKSSEIFRRKENGSYGTKQSWHELIQ